MKRISASSVLVLTLGFSVTPQQVAAQAATHTITVTRDANGTIAPDTTVVNDGFSQLFTITPAAGFYIADVTVDGSSVGSHATYTFANVTADHTISASFALIPLGADTIPGTVRDVSGPTTFTLDPGTPGPFVWFVVMNSDIKSINGNKTIIPGPTTLVIDHLGQLMSAGTTSGITARDNVVVSGRAEPDNGGLFPLSIVDNSVPAPIQITAFAYDAASSSINLKWSSTSGQAYALDYTENLGFWNVLAPKIPGTQGTTTYSGNVPSENRAFFRVRTAN